MTPLAQLDLEILTVNESNGPQGKFWGKQRRRKKIRSTVLLALSAQLRALDLPLPLTVRLTRLSAGTLDDDGVVTALKSVRDGCADFLGVDDKKRDVVRYAYEQEPCKRGTHGIKIEFYPMHRETGPDAWAVGHE
jgi:hypothetical protein